MREDLKRARAQAKIAAEFGIEVPKQVGNTEAYKRENVSREAEAALSYMRRPQMFVERTCTCGKDFKVNRRDITCCSDECRARELEELGIEWDWSRTGAQRWAAMKPSTPEPLLLSSETLKILDEVLNRR